jgi:tagatose 1,6-diphosphate aldolase
LSVRRSVVVKRRKPVVSQQSPTPGKRACIDSCSNERGVIAAMAIDQRGSLAKTVAAATGRVATPDELVEFKAVVAEVLSPYASALLLDTEYGMGAIERREPGTGVLLAYEQSGYETTVKGRQPSLLPTWSVPRLVAAGAQGIKIVLYYDPDDEPAINDRKHAFVERVGAECRGCDVAFFLEPVTYADGMDADSAEYARLKPGKVTRSMEEFSRPEYGVDVLKVEIPINPRYLQGAPGTSEGEGVYSRAEAVEHFQVAAAAARLPFIYLSAGVKDDVFRAMLELAAEASVPYSGVLCGRATWQGGIESYAGGGVVALRGWLENRGVQNIQALNAVLAAGARSWSSSTGGGIGA